MPRKVHVFGVSMEGCYKQINYLLDESETIGLDGKESHGPNSVLSMLHHTLMTNGYGEMCCTLHCDNCSGQNKNQFTLGYLTWRVMTGLHREITLKFQVPGHTRCLVDAGFAHFKKLYRRSDIDTMDELESVVNNSARTNIAVRCTTKLGENTFEWYDWKMFLSRYFRPLKNIRKYYQFRFSSVQPGLIFVKTSSDSAEEPHQILKPAVNDFDVPFPPVIHAAGLSKERKKYLFKNIRPFVKDQNKNIVCPAIDAEE